VKCKRLASCSGWLGSPWNDVHVKMAGSFMDVHSYVGKSIFKNVNQKLAASESFPCEAPCSGSLGMQELTGRPVNPWDFGYFHY